MADFITKSDLSNGDVVELRYPNKDGDIRRRIVIGDTLWGIDNFGNLNNYNDDLTHDHIKSLDIVKVWDNYLDNIKEYKGNINAFCDENEPTYVRYAENGGDEEDEDEVPTKREMTKSEIEDMLGFAINIID